MECDSLSRAACSHLNIHNTMADGKASIPLALVVVVNLESRRKVEPRPP